MHREINTKPINQMLFIDDITDVGAFTRSTHCTALLQ